MQSFNTSDICPNCKKNLGLTKPGFFYGSPIRICPKCKKEYVDYRYHEIAIEGVLEQDTRLPTDEENSKKKKDAFVSLLIGIGSLVLFIIIFMLGWIVYPLLLGIAVGVVGFFKGMKKEGPKDLEKKLAELEIERSHSFDRMKDPQYVEKLKGYGYNV